MRKKIGSFFTGLLGVVIGCLLTLFAVVPKVNENIQLYNLKNDNAQAENTTKTVSKETASSNLRSDMRNLYKDVAKSAMPSVVGITTVFLNDSSQDAYYDFLFGGDSGPRMMQGLGTGVIVDKNGYILTNAHVVEDGEAQKVNVLFNDGTNKPAEVKWFDKNLDLAIIKVEGNNYPVAKLGDSSKVEVGDIAIAIGNPLGLEFERTMTQGIISGTDRTVNVKGDEMSNLLQTDASINEGNSGGPLLNADGEVIGINTVKAGGEGLGFSIPINTAKIFVDLIKQNGTIKEKPMLGISGISLNQIKARLDLKTELKDGVFVAKVFDNSTAKDAKMKKGDIIIKINDKDIKNMSDLQEALYRYGQDISKPIDITYVRGKDVFKEKVNLKQEKPQEKVQQQRPQQRRQIEIPFGFNIFR